MIKIEQETVLLDGELETSPPHFYRVLLHNDDYTTMDFVVMVLQEVFGFSYEKAEGLMMQVHRVGQAVCGVFAYDIAISKCERVRSLAEQEQFPLRCTVELDENG